MRQKIPVWIDCDPGIDDSHALLLALTGGKLNVRGISAVAGNMPVGVTFRNARRVVALAGSEVPVYCGCAEPMVHSTMAHAELFHGKNGLGNVEIPNSTAPLQTLHAVEAMRREIEAQEGALHLIALGPLTNLAFLFKLYPEVRGKLTHLTAMGGGAAGGNATKAAEFNFHCDAEAANIVMQSGVPTTLVDLAGCKNAAVTAEEAKEIWELPGGFSAFVQGLWRYNLALAEKVGNSGFVVYDSIAVASVLEPCLLTTVPCTVRVETRVGATYGKSLVETAGGGNIALSQCTNKALFLQLCRELMGKAPQ